MKRMALSTAVLLVFTVVACGGSEDAELDTQTDDTPIATADAPAGGEPTSADWFQIDDATQTVTLDIVAGATPDMNYWNFNGYTNANPGTITVPVGYTVVINFQNSDPNMAHSVGIEEWQDSWGGSVEVSPVFAGAVSENPASLIDATMPGESEVVQFVADAAGEYAMICYVPGHANLGMVMRFIVSSDGSSGVS